MPRKYEQWKKMRNDYYKATSAEFPYPGAQSVVYGWESTNDFWERRRNNAANFISASKALFDENSTELADLGERVKAQGAAERTKERAFLASALPDFDFSNISDLDLIRKLNEVMNGAKQYENALKRIQAAMAKSKKDGTKNLGPSVSSLFTSYLGTEISQIFYAFCAQPRITEPFSAWTAYFESHLNDAIDKAFKAMTEDLGTKGSEINEIYGDADQWREIGEAYRTIQGYAAQFQDMVRSKIDFTKIGNMFKDASNQTIYRKQRRGSKKSGFRTKVDEMAGLRTRAGQVGGSVAEYLNDIIAKIAPKQVHISESGGTVITSEVTTIDRAVVYQFEGEINLAAQQIADDLNDTMMGTDSLKESANRLQQFYDQNLSKLTNSFITYTSDKMYKLDSDFSGFHNGGHQPLYNLPNYIESAGIDASIGMDFVYTAYNTLETAVYEGQREEIQEQITNVLTAAAAKLLFNDWSTVGVEQTSGAQTLHVFNLDGVIVPVSYVLLNLGQGMIDAAADMSRYFSVSVSLPQTVAYKQGEWHSFGQSDQVIKSVLYAKWKEQFDDAQKESYFSTKFLSNFKGLMNTLMQ